VLGYYGLIHSILLQNIPKAIFLSPTKVVFYPQIISYISVKEGGAFLPQLLEKQILQKDRLFFCFQVSGTPTILRKKVAGTNITSDLEGRLLIILSLTDSYLLIIKSSM